MKIALLDGPGAPSAAVQKIQSPEKRMVERAHDVKVSATGSWMNGHITAAEHRKIHARADKVIKAKGRLK